MLRRVLLILMIIALIFPQTLGQTEAQIEEPVMKIHEAETQDVRQERITSLANRYQADPEYLEYILELEKEFDLKPYSLLALIAQESGFKPQTRMDGGSLSYSTTQMKMASAKTAHMAMSTYYKLNVPYPTHERLRDDEYYAAYLAAGYLRYLHDVYDDEDYMESYTAYNWGIGGRMTFYNRHGHFKSPFALKVLSLQKSFQEYIEGR